MPGPTLRRAAARDPRLLAVAILALIAAVLVLRRLGG
jgi:hypothetical protein